jgi:hypothetical protein
VTQDTGFCVDGNAAWGSIMGGKLIDQLNDSEKCLLSVEFLQIEIVWIFHLSILFNLLMNRIGACFC